MNVHDDDNIIQIEPIRIPEQTQFIQDAQKALDTEWQFVDREEFYKTLSDLFHDPNTTDRQKELVQKTASMLDELDERVNADPNDSKHAKDFEEIQKDFKKKFAALAKQQDEEIELSPEQRLERLRNSLLDLDDNLDPYSPEPEVRELLEFVKNAQLEAKNLDTQLAATNDPEQKEALGKQVDDLEEDFLTELDRLLPNDEYQKIAGQLGQEAEDITIEAPGTVINNRKTLAEIYEELKKEGINASFKEPKLPWNRGPYKGTIKIYNDDIPPKEQYRIVGNKLKSKTSDLASIKKQVELMKDLGYRNISVTSGNEEFRMKVWLEARLQQPQIKVKGIQKPAPEKWINALKTEAQKPERGVNLEDLEEFKALESKKKNEIEIDGEDGVPEVKKVPFNSKDVDLDVRPGKSPTYALKLKNERVDVPPELQDMLDIANKEATTLAKAYRIDKNWRNIQLTQHKERVKNEFDTEKKTLELLSKNVDTLLKETNATERSDGDKIDFGHVIAVKDGRAIVSLNGRHSPKNVDAHWVVLTQEQSEGMKKNLVLRNFTITSEQSVDAKELRRSGASFQDDATGIKGGGGLKQGKSKR